MRIGETLGGRYELTDRIAAGGMGEVWKGKDQILGRTVAVKVLKDGLTDEVGFTDRFRNEARLSAALSHGNIAQVYDYGEDDGSAYLVMEFVAGKPLSKIIADNAPLSAADTVGLIAQAAQALYSAHRNDVVHRDVKPANMLVTEDGIVKVTDFGIARAIGSAAMTKTGEVMGTAQYLAPEAALGQEVTALADVYALGVVAYEMVAGRRPFESDSTVALALAHVNQPPPPMPTEVPAPVRAVIMATLEKDPTLRPDSAQEFARALRQAVADSERMGFDPSTPAPRPQRPSETAQGSGPNAASDPNSPAEALPGRQEVSEHPAPTGPENPPSSHPASKNFKGEPGGPRPTGPNAPATSGPSSFVGTSGSNKAVSGSQSTLPGGMSKTALYAIGGVVGFLLIVLILWLTLGGGSPAPTPPPEGLAPISDAGSPGVGA